MAPTVVALGGTGVIGSALRNVAAQRGYKVLSLSLDPDMNLPGWRNRFFDFAIAAEGALAAFLASALPEGTPIHAICNIAGLSPRSISEVAEFAAMRDAPLAQVSSCLLYRTDGQASIDEDVPTLTADTADFPYIKLKLAEETALTAWEHVAWRILRTNHILGRGSLLGCIPDHNRDPAVLASLRAGKPLRLARRGRVRVSFIHAEDLAAAMLDLCADPSTACQIMNVVNPESVMADAYFCQIATLLGLPEPNITELQPEPEGFWALTARDTHFTSRHPAVDRLTFRYDLASALRDTLLVGEDEYAFLGGHMRDRLQGR